MLASLILIWLLAAALFVAVWVKPAGHLRQAIQHVRQNSALIATRMPFAILTAGFMGTLLPQEFVSDWIGPDSGLLGILIATGMGTLLPGGPFLSFPIALALSRAGAGLPQLVALLTSWSVFEPQRILIWEWPLLGASFVRLRLATSAALPLLAGLSAMALVELWRR